MGDRPPTADSAGDALGQGKDGEGHPSPGEALLEVRRHLAEAGDVAAVELGAGHEVGKVEEVGRVGVGRVPAAQVVAHGLAVLARLDQEVLATDDAGSQQGFGGVLEGVARRQKVDGTSHQEASELAVVPGVFEASLVLLHLVEGPSDALLHLEAVPGSQRGIARHQSLSQGAGLDLA